MKKLIALGIGSMIAAGATSAALFGAGTAAAAPDVVGMKYSDARKEIKNAGGKAVVAVRVGDQLPDNSCIVTNISDSSFLRMTMRGARADRDEMAVSLNCNAGYATGETAGPSVGSPQGREAKEQADEAAAKKRAEQLAAEQAEQQLAQAATPGA